jgi:glycosyltransferase involved in cell wall biosynthesis
LVHTVYEMAVNPLIHRHNPLIVGTGYLRDELSARPGLTILISPPVDIEADAPGAVDPRAFVASLGLSGASPVIVLISRLSETMKASSVETAMRAMLDLRDMKPTLVVVGSGNAEERLRRTGASINALIGRDAIVFAGAMADPRPAYAAADICLGMGGSAARALSFGKPLVVQGEHGHSELFELPSADDLFRRSFWNDARTTDQVPRLVSTLRELAGNSTLREELGALGRCFAVSNFGLEAMAGRLADFYTLAISEYRAADWMRDLPLEARAFTRRYVRGRHLDDGTRVRDRRRVIGPARLRGFGGSVGTAERPGG